MSLSKMVTNITMEMSGDIKKYMVSAVQGDRATRCVLVKLVNNGEPYMIPDGARAIVNIKSQMENSYTTNVHTAEMK